MFPRIHTESLYFICHGVLMTFLPSQLQLSLDSDVWRHKVKAMNELPLSVFLTGSTQCFTFLSWRVLFVRPKFIWFSQSEAAVSSQEQWCCNVGARMQIWWCRATVVLVLAWCCLSTEVKHNHRLFAHFVLHPGLWEGSQNFKRKAGFCVHVSWSSTLF